MLPHMPPEVERQLIKAENRLFFRRWLRHPFRLGTVAPISQKFANYAASFLPELLSGPVVEVGAGTGRLTRALLKGGRLAPEALAAIELDPHLCSFLQNSLPTIKTIEGDARHIKQLIPADWVGQVAAVVSVIPLMYLPIASRREIMENCFSVMGKKGIFLQVTYSSRSPLRSSAGQSIEKLLGLHVKATLAGSLWWNCPPGFVWHYQLDDVL
jgi:phosphatidylethanolamine/phosphatidyl-N-methylethanolamine N-methyltransferase